MTETQTSSERRSSRVFTRIPVQAKGKNILGHKFRAKSQTIVINAHGGLLYVNEELELGADLVLINPATEEEQECRIVYLRSRSLVRRSISWSARAMITSHCLTGFR